ncbi:MAG: 5-dehydro-4-deoxy-D-glucuronate isomerase [Desulfovibrio sp.]|nr:MAG: 5-dehydro-4-deoxy-D-glucuronate isomerase [Desulfovibrio sp.]
MEIRHSIHPDHAATMGTQELRDNFMIESLFSSNAFTLMYSYDDRLIVGGVSPDQPIPLSVDPRIIGGDYLLERREMGVINVGGPGSIAIDGQDYAMAHRDGLFIGKGAKDLVFSSSDSSNPAKFYLNCAPAHKAYPIEHIAFTQAEPLVLGEQATSNHRTIRKYIHPDGAASCQLVMGMTSLETGSVWNTMPVHTHGRRMEAYFYFDLPEDQVVFHFMGKPSETRHLVVRNEQAVLSPSWSIHSGSGTANYTFIWGMVGENQVFTDMDGIPMSELR